MFLVDSLARSGLDVAWVAEEREAHVPVPPRNMSSSLEQLFSFHFQERARIELDYFGGSLGVNHRIVGDKKLLVSKETLNSKETLTFIKKFAPDLILSYGCHILASEILDLIPSRKWNIHGGLSPWYRGTATHFWPSYLLEPQFTGLTLHETTPRVDGGDILLQTAVSPDASHGIHENACEAVLNFVRNLESRLIRTDFSMSELTGIEQRSSGRLFLNSHWNPSLLKVIYETFDNRINEYCLSAGLVEKIPKLVDVF